MREYEYDECDSCACKCCAYNLNHSNCGRCTDCENGDKWESYCSAYKPEDKGDKL